MCLLQVEELEKTNTIKVKELDDLNACVASLREENSQIRTRLQEMQTLKQELESYVDIQLIVNFVNFSVLLYIVV